MTTDPPPSGSVWADRCPDAFPFVWFVALKLTALPQGFTRFATDAETALILGRTDAGKSGARDRPARAPSPSVAPPAKGKAKGHRSAVGQRFRDLSEFLRGPHAELTPTARAVWLSVYTCSKNGTTTITQSTMAKYAGVTTRVVKRAVKTLVADGLLEVVEKGRTGRASTYRYRVPGTGRR